VSSNSENRDCHLYGIQLRCRGTRCTLFCVRSAAHPSVSVVSVFAVSARRLFGDRGLPSPTIAWPTFIAPPLSSPSIRCKVGWAAFSISSSLTSSAICAATVCRTRALCVPARPTDRPASLLVARGGRLRLISDHLSHHPRRPVLSPIIMHGRCQQEHRRAFGLAAPTIDPAWNVNSSVGVQRRGARIQTPANRPDQRD